MSATPRLLATPAWSALAAVVALVGVIVALVVEPSNPLAVPQSVERSAVLVTAEGCRSPSYGSGAVTEAGILTNAHVVAGSTTVLVGLGADDLVAASVVGFDPIHDLALLRTDQPLGEPRHLADAVAPSELVAIGRNDVGARTAQIERIDVMLDRLVRITISDIYGDGHYERDGLVLTAEIGPGDSGAPLIDGDGQLVGLVFSAARGRSDVAYGIATSELRTFIDGAGTAAVDTGTCRNE